MSQTWWGSIVEMKSNLAIGFALNYCINLAILPWLWNPSQPARSAFLIGLVFTVVSVARQLFIRRFFNRIQFGNVPKVATAEGYPPEVKAEIKAQMEAKANKPPLLIGKGHP